MTVLVLGVYGLVLGIVGWLMVLVLRANRRRLAGPSWRPTRYGIMLSWAEVYRVSGYKRDLWSDFYICLFMGRADDTGIEVNEEMAGWEPFCESLPQFLPNYFHPRQTLGEIATYPAMERALEPCGGLILFIVELRLREAEAWNRLR